MYVYSCVTMFDLSCTCTVVLDGTMFDLSCTFTVVLDGTMFDLSCTFTVVWLCLISYVRLQLCGYV